MLIGDVLPQEMAAVVALKIVDSCGACEPETSAFHLALYQVHNYKQYMYHIYHVHYYTTELCGLSTHALPPPSSSTGPIRVQTGSSPAPTLTADTLVPSNTP